jgi:hypothetical protein
MVIKVLFKIKTVALPNIKLLAWSSLMVLLCATTLSYNAIDNQAIDLGASIVSILDLVPQMLKNIYYLLSTYVLPTIGLLRYLFIAYGIRILFFTIFVCIMALFYLNEGYLKSYNTLRCMPVIRLIFLRLWLYIVRIAYLMDINFVNMLVVKYINIFIQPIYEDLVTLSKLVIDSLCIGKVLCESIPWSITEEISEAQNVLTRIFEYLLNEGVEKSDFAKEHLALLVAPINNNTGLPIDFMSSESILKRGLSYTISSGFDATNVGEQYAHKAIIYSFTNKEIDICNTYIGQTQNLINRLGTHHNTSLGKARSYGKLYPYINEAGGMKNLKFHVHHTFPTYQSIWLDTHKFMSTELQYVLRSFTEFKLALIEQALISHYKPGLNANHVVTFNFLNWESGYYKPKASDSYFNLFDIDLANIVANDPAKFHFPIYHNLTESRGLKPLDNSWLEWFIGFSERRGNYHSFAHTNRLSFNNANLDILIYISNELNLKSLPFAREKSGYQLLITGVADSDLIASIFYNNIVTEHFLREFTIYTSNISNRVNLSISSKGLSIANLNNAWLSGVIDAHSSFGFKDRFTPIITFTLTNHPELVIALLSVFEASRQSGNKIVLQGDKKVKPIMDYLDKYPLKYKASTQQWFKECLNLRSLGYQHKQDKKQVLLDLISLQPKT